MANWKVGAARSLAIVERDSWDGSGAKSRIFSWAGFDGDNPSSTKARRAFLAYDAAEPDLKGSYKLPFADVVDGGLKAVDAGLRAAASRLPGTDIPDSVKATARSVLDGYFAKIDGEDSMNQSLQSVMVSMPISGYLGIAGEQVGKAKRAELRMALAAGELDGITFDAVVYIDGPNMNHYRFRGDDLLAFSMSFAGQPFLRNHDTEDIGSRDGTVRTSELNGADFVQKIELTTERGMKSFVEGQIDRFSIGWYFSGITCSICNSDWFGPGCVHWPGQTYTDGKGENPQVCELIFEDPKGKETSAVNAPAVSGTRLLAQLCKQKEQNLKEAMDMEDKQKEEQTLTEPQIEPVVEPVAAVAPAPVAVAGSYEAPVMDKAAIAWVEQIQKIGSAALITNSGLPSPMQEAVRTILGDREVTPAEVNDAIEVQQTAWAALEQQHVVQGHGNAIDASMMETPMDEITAALEWVFGVPDAKTPVPSLRNTAELYRIVTGDDRWRGLFDPDNAKLAGADTTTLADIAVNAMNKVMIALYDGLWTYRWYEPLVSVQPHDGSTHDMAWIQFGGLANLPVVAERGAYTELDVADTKESDSFIKYGGYVGITIEMLRKSQIGLIQAIPRELIRSAMRKRSSLIAAIFSSNTGVGPTLDQDTKALFHTDHGNLATTAFSWAAWKAARLECFKQTELGSSKRQGLWPAYCLVPGDLYDDALIYFGYGQGSGGRPTTTDKDVNPYGESRPGDPRPVPVAVPDWTNVDNWAYLADPKLAPVIQMSYEQLPGGGSHPIPELFSVTSRSSGLLFTNDLLPIKALDWYAYGVATYRGIGKRNI